MKRSTLKEIEREKKKGSNFGEGEPERPLMRGEGGGGGRKERV